MTLDIKICGLKSREAIATALDEGASHIGFIFFEKSPRHLEPAEAGLLRDAASGKAKVVAVTVDADDAALDEIVSVVKPDMLQLHGKETPERVEAVKQRYNLPVMKAFAVREAADLDRIEPYKGIADRFLFDAKAPKGSELPGGNGVSFDWTLLARLDESVDYMLSRWPQRGQCRRRAERGETGWSGYIVWRGRRARRKEPAKDMRILPRRSRRGLIIQGGGHEPAGSAKFISYRSRRAGHVRHFRRTLRCRDTYAAHSRPAGTLGCGQEGPGVQGRA